MTEPRQASDSADLSDLVKWHLKSALATQSRWGNVHNKRHNASAVQRTKNIIFLPVNMAEGNVAEDKGLLRS
jgi:hypothetical protein